MFTKEIFEKRNNFGLQCEKKKKREGKMEKKKKKRKLIEEKQKIWNVLTKYLNNEDRKWLISHQFWFMVLAVAEQINQ